jgi:hypothetical protein
MARIIFVPQYPTPNRYQEWWMTRLPLEFRKAGFEVITLGENYADMMSHRRGDVAHFAPVRMAIEFETRQIAEYSTMKINSDDILFLSDISFPGIFCSALYHYEVPRMFAFCHATSINHYDYFQSVSYSKFPVESSHSILFDTVFVGSKYHQEKLQAIDDRYWRNTEVTYLPFPPLQTFPKETRIYDIVSASRPTKQKVDSELEAEVEKEFGEIVRKNTYSWEEYYKFLSQSKVLLISAREDTFGYQIIDAILNGCIPIARNSFAYPELLAREYLYNDREELFDLLEKALWGLMPFPRIKCKQEMNNFYSNIIKTMKGE